MESGEEIVIDLDSTLDQLINNAKTLRTIETHSGFETEIEALKKTQESLLARVCHRQNLLQEQKKTRLTQKELDVDGKFEQLGKLMHQSAEKCSAARKRPRELYLSRRRKRQSLSKLR